MKVIKIFAAAIAVYSLLSLEAPAAVTSANVTLIPPAVAFVQDENENMLLKHNFASDNGLLIPWNNDVDEEIWVK